MTTGRDERADMASKPPPDNSGIRFGLTDRYGAKRVESTFGMPFDDDDISFTAQARRDMCRVLELQRQITEYGDDGLMRSVERLLSQMIGAQIGLLRAIEEVEARPWWRRRRRNPYARR